jgi:hypothetical protein
MLCNGICMRQLCRFCESHHRTMVTQLSDLLLCSIRTDAQAFESHPNHEAAEYTLIAGQVPQEDIS